MFARDSSFWQDKVYAIFVKVLLRWEVESAKFLMPSVAISFEPLKIKPKLLLSLPQKYSAWILVCVGILFTRIIAGVL